MDQWYTTVNMNVNLIRGRVSPYMSSSVFVICLFFKTVHQWADTGILPERIVFTSAKPLGAFSPEALR